MFPVTVRTENVDANLFGTGTETFLSPSRIGIIGPDPSGEASEWWDFIKVKLPLMPDSDGFELVVQKCATQYGTYTDCAIDEYPLLWNYDTNLQDVTVYSRAPQMTGSSCVWIEAPDETTVVWYKVKYRNTTQDKCGIIYRYQLPAT